MSAGRPRKERPAVSGIPRDRNGAAILTHSAAGYARGCRCDTCTGAATAYAAAYHAGVRKQPDLRTRQQQPEAGKAAARDVANGSQILTHSNGGYCRGCRCPVCTSAHAEYSRNRKAAAP